MIIQVLRQCGDDLTRESVMRQATNLRELELGMLLPGIKFNPNDYYPVKQMQMSRFNGEYTELFGPVLSSGIAGEKPPSGKHQGRALKELRLLVTAIIT